MPKRGSSLSQRGQLCNRYTSMCSENPPSDHFSAKQKLHSSLETAQNCLSTEKPFLAASPPKDSCFSSSSSSCYLSFPGAGRGWGGGRESVEFRGNRNERQSFHHTSHRRAKEIPPFLILSSAANKKNGIHQLARREGRRRGDGRPPLPLEM